MSRKWQSNQYPLTDIEITVGARRYTGTYRIEGGGITVTLSGGGTKTARLGGMSTETLAQLLLSELVWKTGKDRRRR